MSEWLRPCDEDAAHEAWVLNHEQYEPELDEEDE